VRQLGAGVVGDGDKSPAVFTLFSETQSEVRPVENAVD
jgi:hypothetical protein